MSMMMAVLSLLRRCNCWDYYLLLNCDVMGDASTAIHAGLHADCFLAITALWHATAWPALALPAKKESSCQA